MLYTNYIYQILTRAHTFYPTSTTKKRAGAQIQGPYFKPKDKGAAWALARLPTGSEVAQKVDIAAFSIGTSGPLASPAARGDFILVTRAAGGEATFMDNC